MQMLCKSQKPLDVSPAFGGPPMAHYQSPGNLVQDRKIEVVPDAKRRQWRS